MAILVDAAPIIASIDKSSPYRVAAQQCLVAAPEMLVIPSPVTAEVDYLLGARVGEQARRAFLEDLAAQRYRVDCLEPGDYDVIVALEARYADLRPGLADLSLVVLAERLRTRQIVTFDQRHFRAMTPLQGGSFEILPADHP
ncbi:MAG: type II toxin-antitoxin system VapC family toxin [Egibacteraceae bacterium]